MYDNCVDRVPRLGLAAAVALVLPLAMVLAVCLSGPANAADPLGFYIGGAIGQGHLGTGVGGFPGPGPGLLSDRFRGNHFAFQVMTGLRPISWLSAELSYMDFGDLRGSLFGYPARASMKGASALGALYVPTPVIDLYAKAGIARIQSTVTGTAQPCPMCVNPVQFPPVQFYASRTNTSWAGGAGVQYKLGAFGVRGEYERFNAAGESPYMLSLGLTWSFL
jgi:opacity protein-like surface antigen